MKVKTALEHFWKPQWSWGKISQAYRIFRFFEAIDLSDWCNFCGKQKSTGVGDGKCQYCKEPGIRSSFAPCDTCGFRLALDARSCTRCGHVNPTSNHINRKMVQAACTYCQNAGENISLEMINIIERARIHSKHKPYWESKRFSVGRLVSLLAWLRLFL